MCHQPVEGDSNSEDETRSGKSNHLMKRQRVGTNCSHRHYHYQNFFASRHRQNYILQFFLYIATTMFLILVNDPHGLIRSTSIATSTSTTSNSPYATLPYQPASRSDSILHKLGWLDTITYFQKEIAIVANQMFNENMDPQLNSTGFINIAPLQSVIHHAIDEVGVRTLYFRIFSHDNSPLVFHYNFTAQRNFCSLYAHGVECQSHQLWWFYHFVGAITADKLLKEDKLLWDNSGTSKEYVEDMADLLHQIHQVQNTTFVGDFSFHAQHALEWQYVADTMPDLLEYPVELAQRFCGDYQNDTRYIHAHMMSKRIGYECYHGIGHAMFYLAAQRQVSRMTKEASITKFGMDNHDMIMPQIQFRPNGGLELTQRSFCEIKKMCTNATGTERKESPEDQCLGGVVHSIRLYTKRDIFFKKHAAMRLLKLRFQYCNENDDSSLDDMDDVKGYEEEEIIFSRLKESWDQMEENDGNIADGE